MFAVVKSKPNWTYWPGDAILIFIFASSHQLPFLILFSLFCNFSLPLLFHCFFFLFFLFPPAGIGRVILCDVFSYKTRQMRVWHTQYYSIQSSVTPTVVCYSYSLLLLLQSSVTSTVVCYSYSLLLLIQSSVTPTVVCYSYSRLLLL